MGDVQGDLDGTVRGDVEGDVYGNLTGVIKGDLKYGAPRSNPDAGICLHSYKVEFVHPVKKEPLCIIAPLPRSWKGI